MEKLTKCPISELSEILKNMRSWNMVSMKMNELELSTEIMKSHVSKNDPAPLNVIPDKINAIEKLVKEIDDGYYKYFERYGIYADSNFEEMSDIIELEISKKLYQRLRVKMVLDKDAYDNMKIYIERYYECFGFDRKNVNLENDVINFITVMRNNGYM